MKTTIQSFFLVFFIISCVNIKAQDWRAFVTSIGNYQENDEKLCDVFNGGIAKIPRSVIDTSYYWTNFYANLANKLSLGQKFTIEARVKNNAEENGIGAYDTHLYADIDDMVASSVLMGYPEALRFSSIRMGDKIQSSIPSFVQDLSRWRVLKMEISQQQLRTYIDDQLIYVFDHNTSFCELSGFGVTLKGSGSLDWFKIYDQDNRLIYTEDFENCNTFAKLNAPISYSGVINHYAAVEDICGNQFRVQSTKGFEVGDTVMIIQMQGAKIDTTNTSNFGNLLDYGNAGKYEFNIISKIDGDEVFFQRKLLNKYDVYGRVQLVSFPNLGDASICNLTCKPWDGRTGGILAFKGGRIKLYGSIDVTGKGFRGGKYALDKSLSCDSISSDYLFPEYVLGLAAYKGEGIAEIYSALAKGKGKMMNGGGGGNNHNAGGGGGANAGNGGLGGDAWRFCGDPKNGGIGGQKIDYQATETRLCLGGGGGAGHDNNGWGTKGGAGGGIVYVIAEAIENLSSSGILANGESVFAVNSVYTEAGDGGGGGGAGGSVALLINKNPDKPLPIQIRGGNGASVHFEHGHGGGGGGGILFMGKNVNSSNLVIDARGGKSGIGSDGKTNLATDGQPGISRSINELPLNRTEYVMLGWDSISIDPTCAGTTDAYLWVRSSVDTLEYSLDGTSWQSESFFEGLTVTSQRFYVRDGCRQLDTLLKVAFYPKMSVRNNFKDLICNSSGLVELVASQGKAPYSYRQGGQVWQDVGLFNNLAAGIYTFQTTDALGCLQNDTLEIADRSYPLEVVMSKDTTIYKGSNARLTAQVKGVHQQPLGYTWTPMEKLSCPTCAQTYAKPEVSTLYVATIKDANGCIGSGKVQVKVIPNTVYWPNVFAPGTGVNGSFYPQGDPGKITSIDLTIYNRWGNLVYSSKGMSINDSGLGWDGKVNGQAAATGVYVFLGKVEFYDETIEEYKGTVTLLR